MLVEIHILQNHAPANLNRDDTGSPKDCVFGGVRRARISSQCLKRSIRRSDIFQKALEGHLGIRTRQLPELVREAFKKDPVLEPLSELAARKTSGFGTKEGKERGPDKFGKYLTAQTMFLAQADIAAVINVLKEAAQGKNSAQFEKIKTTDLQKSAMSRGFRPVAVDVALFGRMVTDEAIRDVDASCQVAHAISTHRVQQEFDFFTAVDDLQGQDEVEREEDSGADMMGDIEYNSACYYKYFSVDVEGLMDNLVGRNLRKEIPAEDEQRARELTCNAVLAMLEAAVKVTPSGKQNTFASHTLPSAVLIEARPAKTPISYANAFVNPVSPNTQNGNLVNKSVKQFCEHVGKLTHAFGLEANPRLWFAPLHPDANISGTEQMDTFPQLLKRLREALCG